MSASPRGWRCHFRRAPADHRACTYLAEPLAERFRGITPDLRASGRSHHHGPLTWDLLADDIAALARYLDLARAAVGGISFGSGVALRAALRAPTDGIDALVPLLDTLPPAIRERARTVVLSLDPRSVAALSRFMSSGAQPFTTAADLAAITCPTLVIPHPAAVRAALSRSSGGGVRRRARGRA